MTLKIDDIDVALAREAEFALQAARSLRRSIIRAAKEGNANMVKATAIGYGITVDKARFLANKRVAAGPRTRPTKTRDQLAEELAKEDVE